MANPQPDQYTRISNELLEALIRTRVSNHAMRVFLCIMRLTYGYHKKEEKISLTKFSEKTGIDRRNIHRSKNILLSKEMIVEKRYPGKSSVYSIQKDYDKWLTVISPDNTPTVISNGSQLSSLRVKTVISPDNTVKERKKEKETRGGGEEKINNSGDVSKLIRQPPPPMREEL